MRRGRWAVSWLGEGGGRQVQSDTCTWARYAAEAALEENLLEQLLQGCQVFGCGEEGDGLADGQPC